MLNNEFPPLGGGQANANYFILKNLKNKSNLSVDLISASQNEYKEKQFSSISRLLLLDIGKKGQNLHFQSIKDLIIFSWKSFFTAKKIAKDYDLIVAWSGIPSGVLAYFLRIPYIILLRGSDVPFYEKRWKYLDKFIFSWLSPIIWKNAKKVIANSKGLRELALKTAPKQKIEIIENGVDTDFFCPKEHKNKIPIILSVGRLVERKNFASIIKASKNLDCKIQLVGEGPEKENLKKLAEEFSVDLELLGLKNKNELKKIYQKADIFVLPSKNEGMSNALLEALASGLPCIVSDTGGTSELISKNEGIVLEENNSDCLKKHLKYLLENKKILTKMSKNARLKAEKMSWSEVAERFYNEFQ